MSPEIAAYLLALDLCFRYADGATIQEIVAATGLNYRQVRETLLAFGVTLRAPKPRMPPAPPGMVDAYVVQRKSLAEVGEPWGCRPRRGQTDAAAGGSHDPAPRPSAEVVTTDMIHRNRVIRRFRNSWHAASD
ncbi:hypothetical protein [Amycolatopsis plumensis]|uniref:Uncharacterized protein n=1 Tax=Amycolatopsis plumensis TaxID=236508 RepID=A0ABV5UB92_9PSEU